ncbi:nuclear transport factor 2 family protein [Kutzneria sp. CA-103260]|uniref:nuclear transport factor 2 family protein n=1 Tax=Kutzneria sp. CA-103260 TaxID=2802641 RepID=UPI001BAC1D40|nr:nuclear transport factor 2 family protein [Kutzneria sp. CA-103260]QUQ67221.1 SnoaL-like domain protein [Kutzneria sp. CA-103260]
MSRVTRRRVTATALVAGVALTTGIALTAPSASAVPAQEAAAAQRQHLPRLAQQWVNAWNTGDGAAMGALFAPDGVYTDHAFQAAFTGPAGAKLWVELTMRSIANAKVTVKNAFCSGDNIAVTWTFSGTFTDKAALTPPYSAAGKSFAVPVSTVITTRHNLITAVDDYYNLADVLRQVGLPAGPFTPPSMG